MIMMRLRGLFILFMLPALIALCKGDQTTTTAAATTASTTSVQGDQIQQAVDILTAIGGTGWCHPTSEEYAPALPLCESIGAGGGGGEGDEEFDNKDEFFYWKNGILAFTCVVTAALAAGLTMGLLSIDPLLLHIKIRAGSSEQERQQAKDLLPIVEQHHLLLVSLLLLNSMANEALPLFLDALVPSYVAVLMSVTLVLFFGEIIPSALFTGPNQLRLASQLSPLVKIVMALLYPIAKPIAYLLDVVLHDEDTEDNGTFNRGELSALVRIQYEERMASKQRRKRARAEAVLASDHSDKLERENSNRLASTRQLSPTNVAVADGISRISDPSAAVPYDASSDRSIRSDEVVMVEGALKMSTSTAMDVFTPLNRVFAVPYDMMLNERNIVKIYSSGHSRIPVFERDPDKPKDITHLRGVLLSKQLIVVNSSDKRSVASLPIYIPSCVSPRENLVDCINMFQRPSSGSRGGHMALVCTRPKIAKAALEAGKPLPKNAGLLGIITMEDALEELLQEEIYDEMDSHEVHKHRIAKKAFNKWKRFVSRKKESSQVNAVSGEERLSSVVEEAMARSATVASEPGNDAVVVDINNESSPLLP